MATLVPIAEADDPRVAAYLDIQERDLVGRRGGFVAEGEVVLRAAIRSGRHQLDSVLIAEKRTAGLAPLLAQLPDTVPVYLAPQPVMDAITGFHIHRGVLAFGRSAPALDGDTLFAAMPARAVVLGLVGIANHDNMGGLFRNAAAFGAAAVVLDADCCDPLYRKAIRTSVGAALSLPFVKMQSAAAMLDLFERHGFEALALSPSGATRLADLPTPARAAVLVGAEGPGLPDAVMARARTVSIPMAGGFDSLNVAVTAGIVLHQLTQTHPSPSMGEG